MVSMISMANKISNQFPEDLQEYFKCIEKNTIPYCSLRHSDEGRVLCVNSDRATAEAVSWKNSSLHGIRNDCIFNIEVAQFRTSDGVAVIRATVKPKEIFAINDDLRQRGGIFAACRSPLIPVYDTEASRLDYRCAKK